MKAGLAVGLVVLLAGCPQMPNTAPPPGDVSNFDPIAAYPALAAFAGPEARLVAMYARHVRSDGVLDLGAKYQPATGMTFVTRATADDAAAQGELPPGSGFKAGDAISTRVSVITPRLIGSRSTSGRARSWRHLGMERMPEPLGNSQPRFAAPPACRLAALWQAAIARGAPSDVVATIEYSADGYTFEANGRDFKLKFGADCQPR